MPTTKITLDGDARGVLKATAQTEEGLDRVTAKAKQAGAATSKDMTPAINAARGAFASLATQMTNVPGQLGVVIAQFGSLAAGSAVMAGALAGLALMAGAWTKITEESKKAREEQLKAIEDVEAARKQAQLGPGAEAKTQGEAVRAEMARVFGEIGRVAQARGLAGAAPETAHLVPALSGELEELKARFRDLAKSAAFTDREIRAAIQGAASTFTPLLNDVKPPAKEAARSMAELAKAASRFVVILSDVRPTPRHPVGEIGRRAFDRSSSPTLAAFVGPEARQGLQFGPLPFGETLAPSKGLAASESPGQFSEVVGKATDALSSLAPAALAAGAVFEVLRGVMEPLQPILEVFSGLLQAIGNVIGVALAPVLKVVANAFSYVIQAIGFFIEGLGKFIDKIVPDFISKVGKDLAKAGQRMQEDAKAARKMVDLEPKFDSLSKTIDKVSQSLEAGLPSWFRANAYRYLAAGAGAMSGGVAGSPLPAGGVHVDTVNVYPPAGASGAEVFNQVESEAKKRAAAGGTTYFDVRYARSGAV